MPFWRSARRAARSRSIRRYKVRELIAIADSGLSQEHQIQWGVEEVGTGGEKGRWLYVLTRRPELTGGSVSSAAPRVGLDQTNPGAWGVSLQLNPQAGSRFAQLTQANVGRLLAIVLDGEVFSAPRINERIPRGTASITGSFSADDAKDLSVVLEAGSLPAPVKIIEERTVGPSLGRDSIRDGTRAVAVGTIAIVLFMLIYYQASGGLSVVALTLNLYLLLALLAGFGATLTLPGIAGIALTVGMAVDANVLILERIREELRGGKTVRSAINTGYDRAFRTILDANVTTLISAVFLFQFGTRPIRGFAVTLSLGLIVNMFTAVLFTRLIYDMITQRRTLTRLSI
jgi:preprotein translocase subunit SecD